ncbi:pepsin A-like [Platysternon megacephalum]|uniref:Pepsin A-like n=1 Tax=Platysternon megacephalum TaxID=55544 RepID=A0A4D9E8M6_9SAUR|nr:pepsin A-like [Platysternon megacephalum]
MSCPGPGLPQPRPPRVSGQLTARAKPGLRRAQAKGRSSRTSRGKPNPWPAGAREESPSMGPLRPWAGKAESSMSLARPEAGATYGQHCMRLLLEEGWNCTRQLPPARTTVLWLGRGCCC